MERTGRDINGTSCRRLLQQQLPALYILLLIQLIRLLRTVVLVMPTSITWGGVTVFIN